MRTSLTALTVLVLLAFAGATAGLAMASPGHIGTTQVSSTVTARSSAYGRILFDGNGRALYAFTRDRRGRSVCSGATWRAATCGSAEGMETPFLRDSYPMDIAAGIILGVVVFLTAVLIIGLFVWAALKDGQEDKALQTRLGIRRRTRLGR